MTVQSKMRWENERMFSRRGFKVGVVFLACAALAVAQQRYEATWESLDKRPMPTWFADAKFGIFIHWGVYSVPSFAAAGVAKEQPYAEWYWNSLTKGREQPDQSAPGAAAWKFHQRVFGANFPYQDFAPMFRAELFDPDQWAAALAGSGAKYVVLTSKHHEGFALWPSREASGTWGRPWNSVEIGPHRDLVGDLAESVRRKGIKMGFYYSLYEWYNPLWLSDKPRYVREHMQPQFKDLVTKYKPSIIFSDGEWELPSAAWGSPELLAWLFNESSVKDEVVVNDRWGKDTRHKHGGYYTTEYTPGLVGTDHPWEENRGMGFSFGYNRMERLEHYHSSRELVLMLVDLVSRGGNLLLDIGPTADGRIPVIMEERLHDIGAWMKVNSEAIYGTRPWTQSRQWSAGEVPGTDYSKEFMAAYDLSKLTEKGSPGKASLQAFFTKKGDDVYAILPRWERGAFAIKDIDAQDLRTVTLLGSDKTLRWKAGRRAILVDLPELPEQLTRQPAWVLKLSQ